jgi:hypothetical protein
VLYLEDNTVSNLNEARRYRDRQIPELGHQLRHLAGHLAGRNDLLPTNNLTNDLEITADRDIGAEQCLTGCIHNDTNE